MLRTSIFLILSMLVLMGSACTKRGSDKRVHYLTGGGAKYWTEVKKCPIKKYAGLKFNSKVRCEEYVLSNEDGSRIKITRPGHDHFWRLMNDSTLLTGPLGKVRIEYLDDDVMVLNEMHGKGGVVYVKAKDQTTELVEDTPDHSMGL